MDIGTLTTILYVLLGLAAPGPIVSIVGSLVSTFSGLSTVLMAANPWVLAVGVAGAALRAAFMKRSTLCLKAFANVPKIHDPPLRT